MVKNLPAMQEIQVLSLGWEIPWRRKWQPTPVFLHGEFHGQRSLAGYSPWDCKESDTTERLTLLLFFFLNRILTLFNQLDVNSHIFQHINKFDFTLLPQILMRSDI